MPPIPIPLEDLSKYLDEYSPKYFRVIAGYFTPVNEDALNKITLKGYRFERLGGTVNGCLFLAPKK